MSHRVLIVEDDDILREIYVAKFSLEGFDVAAASDGQEGLEQAQQHRPHVIILDMLMPRVGGQDFLKRFRSTPAAAQAKILVASNKSAEDFESAVLELGASEYLVKSHYTPAEIVAKARQHLQSA